MGDGPEMPIAVAFTDAAGWSVNDIHRASSASTVYTATAKVHCGLPKHLISYVIQTLCVCTGPVVVQHSYG